MSGLKATDVPRVRLWKAGTWPHGARDPALPQCLGCPAWAFAALASPSHLTTAAPSRLGVTKCPAWCLLVSQHRCRSSQRSPRMTIPASSVRPSREQGCGAGPQPAAWGEADPVLSRSAPAMAASGLCAVSVATRRAQALPGCTA